MAPTPHTWAVSAMAVLVVAILAACGLDGTPGPCSLPAADEVRPVVTTDATTFDPWLHVRGTPPPATPDRQQDAYVKD